MITIRSIFFIVVFLFSYLSCSVNDKRYRQNIDYYNNPVLFHQAMKKLSDIIVYDIFSPPVASRIYAYPTIAAYEVLINNHLEYKSFAGQLNELANVPKPDQMLEYSFPLASIHAFLIVGKDLIFSEDQMEDFQTKLYQEIKSKGIPNDIFNRSLEYGELVANHIINWANKDNYKQTRSYPKYTIERDKESWKPTPPDYMEGIEPHWDKIRTFVLDSSDQFVVSPPTEFNMNKNSKFYEEVIEVYEIVNNLTEEQKEIASFWDCNPYVSHHKGHAMFATKKITPGGHWIGITSIVTQKANLNMIETISTYAKVSIGLFDSFIACWDEKWRSILIRPETVINEYIDEDWIPFLQTPPFPEYTSGHSVISRSAAVILTNILGKNFKFLDTSEIEYGLPSREFNSFLEASDEAAISRIYGGIHYMPAIYNGVRQGEMVGNYILSNIDLIDPSVVKK